MAVLSSMADSICALLQAEAAEAAPAEESEARPQEEAPVEVTATPAPAEAGSTAASKKARSQPFGLLAR